MSTLANLSRRTANLTSSPIREILAVIDRPGMISFAGGLPASDLFPDLALAEVPRSCLQYGATEGEPALRERIARDLQTLGIDCATEQVLVLSGSQQGIDLVAKLMIDEGTPVAVETPTYLAALQVLRFFGARFVTINTRQATDPDFSGVRLAYVNPTFQNPTGRCQSLAERQMLARACQAHRTVLFEDDPYRELVYDPCERTPLCAEMRDGLWIYQGSFSKSLAPGLRLGFIAACTELIPHLTRLKQAADLHSNRVSQWLVLDQLNRTDRESRLLTLQDRYRTRRDLFEARLHARLGSLATWERPPGGLFFWLKLKRPIDTRPLLAESIAHNVAFMPGESFYADPQQGVGTLRLNFSHASPDDADRGLAKLATLLSRAGDFQ